MIRAGTKDAEGVSEYDMAKRQKVSVGFKTEEHILAVVDISSLL